MNYGSIIDNRLYIFQHGELSTPENDELIAEIFKHENLDQPNKIELIDSFVDYDLFTIQCNGKSYILKYSLDEFNTCLQYEFDIIKNLNIKNVLKPIIYNKFKFGEEINYSIYLDAKSPSVKNFGLSCITSNIDLLFDSYFNLQKSIKPKRKHEELILEFIKNHSFDFFSENLIKSISLRYDVDKIKKIIETLHSDIFQICQSDILNKDEFCHGDFNQSNILYCFNHFKFINFDNSFTGNSYCDLANLVIYCGFDKNVEEFLFSYFLKKKNSNEFEKEWLDYRKCYDLTLRKVLLETLFNFLKEIYLFESKRSSKFLDIINYISRNEKNILKIPVVNENFEFLYNLFLQPLIGVENKNN
jgi:hypothetical protein